MEGRRIRFIADFDYRQTKNTTIAYKAGMVEFVDEACASRAIQRGKAEEWQVSPPPDGVTDRLKNRTSRRDRKKTV